MQQHENMRKEDALKSYFDNEMNKDNIDAKNYDNLSEICGQLETIT